MSYSFAKTIETKKGTFNAGQPLPPEWAGKETIRQLRERYGEDVLVDSGLANASVEARLSAIERSLEDIKRELGVKPVGGANAAKGRA